jgi:S-adenosylmethionine:tRNA ribosyltransferase-isomerase
MATMDEFDYDLPEEAIAQAPAEPRDAARLLVDRGPGAPPQHAHVRDLPDLLQPGDLVVVNDTRVIPARLHLRRDTGGAVEVLLLEPVKDDVWEALVRPSRKLRVGEVLRGAHPSGDDLVVEVGERAEELGVRFVRLITDGDPYEALARHGEVPLPPYIHKQLADPARYQTVYANRPGSVAAPTAGLHLTPAVLDGFAARGIGVERVELVVGLDTFRPVTVDEPADHHIHSEKLVVRPEVLQRCREARRVVAIGTTTVRALESAARGTLEGSTELFIHGDFDWQVVDVLLTNFHLPRSSLLLLVDAFIGPRWRSLYEGALRDGYRFFSFGDAMLLERTGRTPDEDRAADDRAADDAETRSA